MNCPHDTPNCQCQEDPMPMKKADEPKLDEPGQVADAITEFRQRLLFGDYDDAGLPSVSEAESIAGLAYLELAAQAFRKAQLWLVHARSGR